MNADRKLDALCRWARWQLGRLTARGPRVVPFVDSSRLLVAPGMTGATQNIYCGLADYQEMAFLLHALRRDELFVDVGANVGAYTVLATAAVGARAVCFDLQEPMIEWLRRNARLNGVEDRVEANVAAVGETVGRLWQGPVRGPETSVATSDEERTSEVLAVTLDSALQGRIPALIKIDVEGFELPVIRGAPKTLASPDLRALIVEINGNEWRYGFSSHELVKVLEQSGFRPAVYDPRARVLSWLAEVTASDANTIFVRDIDAMNVHVKSAPRFHTLCGPV